MKRIIFFLLFVPTLIAFGQNNNRIIDSLKSELAKTPTDISRVDLLNLLSTENRYANANDQLKYATKAKELAKKINYKKGLATSYYNVGMYYYLTIGDYTAATSNYEQAQVLAQQIGCVDLYRKTLVSLGHTYNMRGNYRIAKKYYDNILKIAVSEKDYKLQSTILDGIGVSFSNQGLYDSATAYGIKSLQIAEKLKDSLMMARVMTNLGRSQVIRKDIDKAMEYFTTALKTATKHNDKSIIAYTLENIGDVWVKTDPKKAIDYFSRSLVLAKELDDVSLVATLYMSLGDIYSGMKDYDKAYNYYKLGIESAKENDDKELTLQLLNSIGLVLIDKKNYQKAIEYLEQALEANNTSGLKIPLSNTYKELAKAYAGLNNYEKAYHYHLLHTTVDSTVFNTDREKAALEITSKYNVEKKVKEILVLRKDNEIKNLQLSNNQLILVATTVICVLLLVICIIFYNKFQAKRKSNEEKEVLLREIHHRVKNNMQIILSILSLEVRKSDDVNAVSFFKESESRIQSMAIIHEMLYQSHNLANISFNDYICQLVDYIFKIYNVNTEKIKYKIDSSDVHLDINTAVPLGLIVNELVCNSLKHAFAKRDSGMITIQLINEKPKEYELVIGDTGVGLPDNFEIKKTTTLGLKLIQTLTKQIEGKLKITSENGVVFSICFKETV